MRDGLEKPLEDVCKALDELRSEMIKFVEERGIEISVTELSASELIKREPVRLREVEMMKFNDQHVTIFGSAADPVTRRGAGDVDVSFWGALPGSEAARLYDAYAVQHDAHPDAEEARLAYDAVLAAEAREAEALAATWRDKYAPGLPLDMHRGLGIPAPAGLPAPSIVLAGKQPCVERLHNLSSIIRAHPASASALRAALAAESDGAYRVTLGRMASVDGAAVFTPQGPDERGLEGYVEGLTALRSAARHTAPGVISGVGSKLLARLIVEDPRPTDAAFLDELWKGSPGGGMPAVSIVLDPLNDRFRVHYGREGWYHRRTKRRLGPAAEDLLWPGPQAGTLTEPIKS